MNRLPRLCLLSLAAAAFALFAVAGAQDLPTGATPIRYVVSLADAPHHLVNVKMSLPPGPAELDVSLPVWNALYQIRDFSQLVDWVKAKGPGGEGVFLRKIDKSTWHITQAEHGVEVEYEIFADTPAPFGAQLNPQHAFFNPAQLLMYSASTRASPVLIRFTDVPAGWKVATSIAISDGGDLVAENYDRLVDSPIELGTFEEADFDEGGGRYRIVVDADPADYDMGSIIATLRPLVSAATTWMQDRPFSSYLSLYHFPRASSGGGMEHAYGTAISISTQSLASTPGALADLTAHEFFHLWNVKRIRPQSLEPIDYSKENYTTALWFSEGVTSTAGDIIRLRAGLLDEVGYRRELAAQIGELQQRAAHRTQSAEESSLDAWLEKYPYYRLPGRSISYYNKGDLLGVLLDLQVREASHGSASLRDVFLWLNQNYARRGRFFPDSDGVKEAAEAVSHSSFASFFQKYVRGTEEISWDDFFRTVGLRLAQGTRRVADPEFVVVRNFDSTPVIAAVTPDSSAERAGLRVGDSILMVDGHIGGADIEQRLAAMRPGDTLRLRVRNHAGDRDLQWQLAGKESVEFELRNVDNMTPQQKARRAAWLKGESQTPGEAAP